MIEKYRDFENVVDLSHPLNTRVILGQDGTLKEVSKNWWGWENWTIFGANSAGVKANNKIVEDFKRVTREKYGTIVNSFFTELSYKEGDPLTVYMIRRIFQKIDAAELRSRANAVTDKIKIIEEILLDVRKELKSASDGYGSHFEWLKREKAGPQDIPDKVDSNFVEETIKDVEGFIKQTKSAIHLMNDHIIDNRLHQAEEELKNVITLSLAAENSCKNILSIQGGIEDGVASSISTEGKKVPPCDDFPEQSFYDKLLGDIYKKRCDLWEQTYSTYFSEKFRSSPPPSLKGPLTTCADIIGLSNPTGNCAINSSLQLVKTALRGIRNTLEWGRVSENLEKKMPYLLKFLQNELSTEHDCQELHKETARALAEDFWYSSFSYRGIAAEQLEKGHFYGAVSKSVVAVLLHRLELPPVCFQQPENGIEQTSRLHALQVLTVNPSSSNASINDLMNAELKREGRILDGPIPSILCIAPNERATSGLLQPITLQHKDGSQITYEPKSMSCSVWHEGRGHSFAFIKTNDLWHEVNDDGISPVPKDWENMLNDYCSRHASNIIYERKREDASDASPGATVPFTSQEANIKAIRHEKEYSFLKKVDDAFQGQVAMTKEQESTRAALEQKLKAASSAFVTSKSLDDLGKLKEEISLMQDFWTERIDACTKGLEKASGLLKPYWQKSLLDAEAEKEAMDKMLLSIENIKKQFPFFKTGDLQEKELLVALSNFSKSKSLDDYEKLKKAIKSSLDFWRDKSGEYYQCWNDASNLLKPFWTELLQDASDKIMEMHNELHTIKKSFSLRMKPSKLFRSFFKTLVASKVNDTESRPT